MSNIVKFDYQYVPIEDFNLDNLHMRNKNIFLCRINHLFIVCRLLNIDVSIKKTYKDINHDNGHFDIKMIDEKNTYIIKLYFCDSVIFKMFYYSNLKLNWNLFFLDFISFSNYGKDNYLLISIENHQNMIYLTDAIVESIF